MEFSIIGYTGFVGSHLCNALDVVHKYNSSNISEIGETHHDIIVCCAPSASKWMVNKNPDADKRNIDNILKNLSGVICKKFILISSIDVYDNLNLSNEDSFIDPYKNHSYGRNRFFMEEGCRGIFGEKLSILRLPGLYGFGLKKNIIFDFINKKLERINLDSSFQWYNIEYIQNDILYLLEKEIPLMNLFTEPVKNSELLEIFKQFGKTDNIEIITEKNEGGVKYNCRTKYTDSGFWSTKSRVLADLKLYLASMLSESNICVSSLCWKNGINKELLSKYNVKKMEVSPLTYFGDGFIKKELEYFDNFKKDNIYSFQSIFYGKNFTIVDEYDEVSGYLKKIIDIAERISVNIIVFGSPSVRKIKSESDHQTMFMFFREIAEYLKNKKVILCIEPNSSSYGCNFLVNSKEASEFVRSINSDNIQMMLDTGCMYLENEDIEDSILKNSDIIKHFHFSSPGLANIFSISRKIKFKPIISKLKEVGYTGCITLECLNISDQEIDKSLYEVFRKKKILVIGAGWYGCHLSKKLIEAGQIVNIVDKRGIFSGSSAYNQNRLHLGFHYPRSYNTRYLCKNNFKRFNDEYGEFTKKIENNIYLISKDSLIDFKTYKQIMEASGLNFLDFDISQMNISNVEGGISCGEKFIDHTSIKDYFSRELSKHLSISRVGNPFDLSDFFDFILDATNNSFGIAKLENSDGFYENTLSLIYKKKSKESSAYTVMDGGFFSIYPYDLNSDYYTLTDVRLTPFKKSKQLSDMEFTPDDLWLKEMIVGFERNAKKYLPDFNSDYEYVDYFISRKNKFEFANDSRELVSSINKNIITFTCGKITGIFECEDLLKKMEIL